MALITRRAALSQLLAGASVHLSGALGIGIPSTLFAVASDTSQSQNGDIARLVLSFMNKFDVPGVSVAVSRGQELIYQQSFGVSDAEAREKLKDSNLFRIASITKPITSTAVFSLLEKMSAPSKTVFGEHGILGQKFGTPPYQPWVEEITVEHLLTHTCGGWANDSTDPMIRFLDWGHEELISWVIHNLPLKCRPGTSYSYSNFGYCVLGRVIKELSGENYPNYVDNAVLSRCGISDMRIGGNTPRDRSPNEVVYFGQSENPYGVNVKRMDSNGGWLATASDLVRFASGLDRVLKPDTIKQMLTPSDVNPGYAHGWSVNSQGHSHNGSLPGTTTYLAKESTGLCCAALTNTRRQPSRVIEQDLQNAVWNIINLFKRASGT
jgi:CubicO group peptidase (beta-lactamase class C family)